MCEDVQKRMQEKMKAEKVIFDCMEEVSDYKKKKKINGCCENIKRPMRICIGLFSCDLFAKTE